MKAHSLLLAIAFSVECAQSLRNIVYFDQYHTTTLPPRTVTAGITHVIMAFANSSLFVGDTPGQYTPFMPVDDVRALLDEHAQVGIAIGGWGDTAGFGEGAKTDSSRKAYAKNVATMLDTHGFDFLDVDWEYPGGNGDDYKKVPNANKTDEIVTFPLLLQEIGTAIGNRTLSIAVPGLKRDMIAYTREQSTKIWNAVDFVNIMAYDLINRRDNVTKHHTDVDGSLAAVQNYLDLGLCASKINLGFAFYAKYFQTEAGVNCTATPVGCPIKKAENDDGSDAGTSGATTFETANVAPPLPPTNLTTTSDGTCGASTYFTCAGHAEAPCCSQYGFCGAADAFCGAGCQSGYGNCTDTGRTTAESFVDALKSGWTDEKAGGQWWWDEEAELFWTFETVALIQRKFKEIVTAKGLGGAFSWSLGEDSYDWSHLLAITEEVNKTEQQAAG
ncbi:glycoside hydrolase superfamily [Truncatella angustata]|uniref:chitinase n=1 Tax=Truncatella angustata TaxID=152316 RepID=A0A9P8ZWH7_9PEZI|nr:glycoside hydrolase superfamily [Truncatella angustata]KAH6652112.1 glycoside hydrolase superfamily [Truncatella angustata]KAH8205026.1 hypothetical protein TruAng_000749 [Truncatella angustata]